jgi:cytochrome b5
MAEETKLFTLAQVKEHHTNKSAWLAIHNQVYDVTAFLNEVGN